MSNASTMKAEVVFSNTEEKAEQAEIEQNERDQQRADHVANLKALRLAKEENDKKAAESEKAEKLAAKGKKVKRLPQAHRQS
jgi:hypothetical protein